MLCFLEKKIGSKCAQNWSEISPKTRAIQLVFIESHAQTQLSRHDLDVIQLQAFEPEQRNIERRMTAQNDHLGKDKRATSDNQLRYEEETTSGKGKRTTSDNQLGYENETTSGKGKQATLDNQLGHEDEENDVKRRTSPKALHKDLDEFGDQPGRKS